MYIDPIMEIQQFEHLETKVIALVELAKQREGINKKFSQQIKDLENKIVLLSEKNDSLNSISYENTRLSNENKKLNTERELIQEKIGNLLGRIESLETELK